MNLSNKTKVILFFLSIIIAIILLNIEWLNNLKSKPVTSIVLDECDVQLKKCNAEIDGINVEISTDKNIFYLEQFNVSVLTKSKKNNINEIYINFKMKNMNMGFNRFALIKNSTNNIKQLWNGKALLPVCITGRADWFAELEIITTEKKYILSFPVSVRKVRNQ